MDRELAEALNRGCDCVSTDAQALARSLDERMTEGWAKALAASHPDLFAPLPVFVGRAELESMRATIAAILRVASLPAYVARALAGVDPAIARDTGARGVLFGFDFHLAARPQLIEINTNAGGALLQLALARSQRPCCEEVARAFELPFDADGLEGRLVAMFREELALARPGATLARVAIVDDDPSSQFLKPEFELFVALFARHGVHAAVVDPSELERVGDSLRVRGCELPIDLVYLRSTDFRLASPSHALLRAAFIEGAVVVTPPPRAHALYADKANLEALSSATALRSLGAREEDVATLTAHVPVTRRARDFTAEALWAERRRWFFKPRDGFGSRAAYRGDKLTRRVFDAIIGDVDRYVVQEVVPPSERTGGAAGALKIDVRVFVYAGEVLMVAGRLYRGQTTNMRTKGGGLAAVLGARAGD
jgi:hypothetical protein